MTLLSDVGVQVLQDERYLDLYKDLGARVDGRRVRLDPELVDAALVSAPKQWTLKPRGGDTEPLILADGNIYTGTAHDCMYVWDSNLRERRRALLADVEGMAALSEKLPNIDFAMTVALAEDAPWKAADVAHVAATLKGTRKPLLLTPTNGKRLRLIREMAAICGEESSFAVLAMPSPPLQHDADALSKVVACAELQIPLVYAPGPCAGTTSPRSITATVLVANAEILSGLVLHQYVHPAAPFVYGAGGGAMDMRTGRDPYTAPEVCLALQACCDLARFYNLPSYSFLGLTQSDKLDEQWSSEAALSTLLGMLSRATLLHDVGGMENGMLCSYEAMAFGEELVRYAKAVMREVPVNGHALALDEIAAVGPGGHHLARPYTRTHYREFWTSELFDNTGHNSPSGARGLTLEDRVRSKVERLCGQERTFVLTTEQTRELEAIVAGC